MKKSYMRLGDQRGVTGSSVDRFHDFNRFKNDGRITAHDVLAGIVDEWTSWRNSDEPKGTGQRALAGCFMLRVFSGVLEQSSSDPAAIAFINLLGDKMTSREHAINMQAQRLADAVNGVTATGDGQFSPFPILDETVQTKDDQDTTTELIYRTYVALGMEGDLESAQAVPIEFTSSETPIAWRRSLTLHGSNRAYQLNWETFQLDNATDRHTLILQMAPSPLPD